MFEPNEPMISRIDEEMLRQAMEEQGTKGKGGIIAKQGGIPIDQKDALHLRLDCRHILWIDNLWQFTSLTKLQLNNNIIEKVTGLEFLTNLVWLDLSFNHIEKIEGLDALVKLEDLSLSNNDISTIENMDTLINLHVLSICNNKLSQLDNVIYLRKFKNLRAVNLAGNPLSAEECYKEFLAGYLPDLVYLDFRLLNEQTKEAARAKYELDLNELIKTETLEQKAIEAKNKMAEEIQQHRDAFVEFLNGSQLFESMYANDTEAKKLAYLPEVPTMVEEYKTQMTALCVQLFEIGMTQKCARDEEVKCFFDCLHGAVEDNQRVASEMIVEFDKSRKEMQQEIQRMADQQLLLSRIEQGSKEIRNLHNALMSLELLVDEQLEDVVNSFERNISDMVATFIEDARGIFAQCHNLEDNHHRKLLEISMATMEKVWKKDNSPDELLELLVDKDTAMGAIGASRNTHLQTIDSHEDELITRINSWKTGLIKSIHHDTWTRNRKRIAEIHHYTTYVQNQLDNMST